MIRKLSTTATLAIISVTTIFAVSLRADAAGDPREKLETALPEAIRLLEAKDYATLLKEFVAPDDFKHITENQSLEQFAKEFGEDKAAGVLKDLKSIKDKTPELSAEGNKATFAREDANAKPIVWVKIDKYWYIAN